MAFRQLAYLPDRRSTRTDQSVHVTVRGADAARVPYQEKVSTLSISCHGCRYLSRNKVLLGDVVTLEAVHRKAGVQPAAQARVRLVRQLAANEMFFDIAVELEIPRDIWGIASPPADWAEFSQADAAVGDSTRELRIVPRYELPQATASKPIPASPLRRARPFETRPAPPLPPLLAQLVASLREDMAAAASQPNRPAIAGDADESFEKLCSQMERKAMKVFEGLVKTLVEDLTSRSRLMSETREASAFTAHPRSTGDSSKR